jgi:predicted DCC family thiol-disulfide oxidoreductase YuxK
MPLPEPEHGSSHLAPPDLPDPDDRPGADVVIFDGSCPLCTALCRGLERVGGRGRLAYLSLYDRRAEERYPDLPRRELLEHVYVIEPNGRRHRGAEAIRHLARWVPGMWPLVPLLYVPGSLPVWEWLYSAFSRRRHRISHALRVP